MIYDDGGDNIVMPFTVCSSLGGPYDDAAFQAGWNCALIDRVLNSNRYAYFEDVVQTPLVPQLDLLAMHHGYTMRSRPVAGMDPDEYTHIAFTRSYDKDTP